jgi:DeoR family transcriptional regulator of aga operon/DeoR family fructose operon transcriptional repressor
MTYHVTPEKQGSLRIDLTPESAGWTYISFKVVALGDGEVFEATTGGEERAFVPLAGKATVHYAEEQAVLTRRDVWSEVPAVLYLPPRMSYRLEAHGGAVYVHKSRYSLSFFEKVQFQAREKHAIAAAALEFINEGDTIILDAGSTTLALAELIKNQFRKLFVITCSIPVALELSHTSWDLMLIGGQVRHHSLALIGPAAVTTPENYHADKAFLGTTGPTLKQGYSTPNPLDAQIKQAILRATDEAYILADSSKIGHAALARFAQFEEAKALITDTGAPQDFLAEFQRRGLRCVLGDPETELTNGEEKLSAPSLT